jgi:hypothetical protein
MEKLFLTASMLLMFGVTSAQVKKCNGNILKLKNGTIEVYDASGINKKSSMLSNVKDFDCNDNEIAVVKTDGSIVFYSTGGNTKFSCGRGAARIQYLDSKYYVVTKEDGSMRKYEIGGCNDRGTP